MSEAHYTDHETLSPSQVALVDQVCDRFEDACKAGPRPRIAEYLAGIPEPSRPALLHELIALDVAYRHRAGEEPRTEDYQEWIPFLNRERLERLLAAGSTPREQPGTVQRTAEQNPARSKRIRCPHCHNPMQLSDERSDEVLCPACGSAFTVQDTRLTSTTSGMRQLGKFQLLERVGLGAFGAVWKARDTELDRLVALKIPHSSLLAAPADLERFYREARAAAQLRHPGIVTVHEVTTLEGLPAIVSDFIEGITLREWLQMRPPTFQESAQLVAQVAEALDYAHAMRLVHRDIKPANIMLEFGGGPDLDAGRDGHPPSEGPRPLVMDFGLALRAEAEITLTVEGQIIGTPAYMSPEQAAGRGHQVDGRGDVYSLGVVLYELLCGELPFRGSRGMIVHQVLHEEPRPPRQINDKIPRDLETICLKALAKTPGRRYDSARALADDLRRFLKGEPIQARPIGVGERLALWGKRRPALVAFLLMSVVAVMALTGLCVGLWFNVHLSEALAARTVAKEEAEVARQAEEQEKRLAESARQEAQNALAKTNNVLYLNSFLLAHREWQDNQVSRARERLDACPEDLRNWEWRYLKRLCHADRLTLHGHTVPVLSVAFSPDGRWLASGSYDRTVRIWDATSGKEIHAISKHSRAVLCVTFSPDGRWLASGSEDLTMELWDALTGKAIRSFPKKHTGFISSLAFSSDGKHLASASQDKTVRLWDPTTGEEIRTFQGHTNTVIGVAFSPDGKRLASAARDRSVRIWDLESGKEIQRLEHVDSVRSVAFSPDGKYLASASEDRSVKLWDTATWRETRSLLGHASGVTCAAFAPDGKFLVSASNDKTIKVWDLAMPVNADVLTLRGHDNYVQCVAFSPDGKHLVSGSSDKTIKVWDLATGIFQEHTSKVSSVAFSPNSKRLASASLDNTVKVWEVATGEKPLTLKGHADPVAGVTFSPDGTRLATAGWDKTARVWNALTGQELLRLEGHEDVLWSVAFSPNGKFLATASSDQTVKVWDATTGQVHFTLNGHKNPVASVAFSPDGRLLASASWDRTVKLWDLTTRQATHTLERHTDRVMGVAFSPDGKRLASAGWDQTVRVWDTNSAEEIFTLRGDSRLDGVAFSSDGKRLASHGWETVRIWDATFGTEILSLRGHMQQVASVAFSPDGLWLASAGEDKRVKVWDARPEGPKHR